MLFYRVKMVIICLILFAMQSIKTMITMPYHLLKSYSLCQLFLENEHENELDKKASGVLG